MTVLTIRKGTIKQRIQADGKPWDTAIVKTAVAGPVSISATGIDGDQQADREHHGGVDKAILLYCRDHYRLWRQEYATAAPPEGSLGENLEVSGLSEESVCIGDIYVCSGVRLEVSQPRQPCWKPAVLHSLPDLTARMLKSGRIGWCVRVLQGGFIEAPAIWELVSRPNPQWTVQRSSFVRHFSRNSAEIASLSSLKALSAVWREALAGRQ